MHRDSNSSAGAAQHAIQEGQLVELPVREGDHRDGKAGLNDLQSTENYTRAKTNEGDQRSPLAVTGTSKEGFGSLAAEIRFLPSKVAPCTLSQIGVGAYPVVTKPIWIWPKGIR